MNTIESEKRDTMKRRGTFLCYLALRDLELSEFVCGKSLITLSCFDRVDDVVFGAKVELQESSFASTPLELRNE